MTINILAFQPAQVLFRSEIRKFLPAIPADVLVVSTNFDESVLLFDIAAYAPVQKKDLRLDYVQLPHGAGQGIRNLKVPVFELCAHRFDAIFIANFDADIHPLALFDQLDHALAHDGTVVLTGTRDITVEYRLPEWLNHVVDIGERCGYSLQSKQNVEDVISNSECFLYVFRRKEIPPRWRIAHVLSTDFDVIATLFHDVFGHPLSHALWKWKYAEGRGNAIIVRRDGMVVAHYGGMYRNIFICGKPDWAFQICDVMVHPKERGVLTRQGPFLLAAATSAEIYGPLGFGFPNQRAMRVAEKMGLYAEAGKMTEVRWQPAAPGFRMLSKVRHLIAESDVDKSIVNQLWQHMAHDLKSGVVGIRDWDFLEQRYFRHPHIHYEVLLVTHRLTGKPLGVAVMRNHEGRCELLDIVAPLKNLSAVLDQARRMTGIWGLSYLYCWITTTYASMFVACGGTEEQLDISIPTSCWTSDSRADVFKNKWWLMSGDTDFH